MSNENGRTNYALCIDSFTGVGGYETGEYLQEFSREEDFSNRLKNSYYENNIVGMIASSTEPVFGDKVRREGSSDLYQAFT